ncbi:MAG: Eco57I restriction-modification methylase domain-containing protein, partial [Planctomycetota bacterium]
MRPRTRDLFPALRTEGGLLPADLLARIRAGDSEVPGLSTKDYGLRAGERIAEAATRAWNRLSAAWSAFRDAARRLAPDDPGTGLTRERWLLILFDALGYGRLAPARGVEIDGKSYPISHFWNHVPIHLVGWNVEIDRRTPGVAGAARTTPHGLLQEYLNRSDESLWGFVSNGRRLRILRDSSTLTRQAYVEFDLEGLMEGEIYAEFVLLWLLCHRSRVEGEKPEDSWLERWTAHAREQGTRALDSLRKGVEDAIRALGSGFLAQRSNNALRERLRAGRLAAQDYYRELLRLAYRLIFLFAAEDRDLLLDPAAGSAPRERFTRYYSTARLRRLAERRRGTDHVDLFRALRLVMEKLGSDEGCPALALPALGSFLWSNEAIADIAACDIANRDLLDAVRALAFTVQEGVFRAVDYKNLGTEELGSIYESLLELHPEIHAEAATFELKTASGHERKTTGSYYTPASLIQCLLDSALEPVLEEAARKPDPERAILSLKICDPACGSGHFLIAAAHRMAKRLAAIRTGDEEPSPEAVRAALRDVIARTIHGVDLNPMAVELCKVSLWLEALEPGKPLAFLEHRILCGNSLIGATPALLDAGIPDDAFKPIEGDDKKFSSALARMNRQERKEAKAGQLRLGFVVEPPKHAAIAERLAAIDSVADGSIAGIHEKEARLRRLADSPEYTRERLAADAWCAAFLWKKTKDALPAITQETFLRIREEPDRVSLAVREEVARLASQYQFLHWHLAFPDVFRVPAEGEPENAQAGWSGGFDVVLGNPPWE